MTNSSNQESKNKSIKHISNRVKTVTTPSTLTTPIYEFIARPDRTIEWLGGVTYDNLQRTLTSLKQMMLQNKEDEVHVLINSYGGTTGIAMNFFDAVTTLFKPKLITIGSGDVDSSGIILLQAGQKRYLTKNTTLLLHLAGRTFEQGKRYSTADMHNMLKEDKLKDYQYACVLSEKMNGRYSPEKILELMANDTILTAEEAVNIGLADKILE